MLTDAFYALPALGRLGNHTLQGGQEMVHRPQEGEEVDHTLQGEEVDRKLVTELEVVPPWWL